MIANAQWAKRTQHTAVIDAAGAIYVIGGYSGSKYFSDVWLSTDGGAASIRGYSEGTQGAVKGCSRRTQLRGSHGGTNGVLSGSCRVPCGTQRALCVLMYAYMSSD